MNKTKSHTGAIITSVILVVLAVFFLLNRVAVIDWFKGIGYNPTPDVLTLKSSLSLTLEGERIFNATRPLLASRDDFNNSCESHDEAVTVLGCYTGDRVYIYNVDDETLNGIRESTASHELLHAIWSRLSGYEKTQIIPLLEETYKITLNSKKPSTPTPKKNNSTNSTSASVRKSKTSPRTSKPTTPNSSPTKTKSSPTTTPTSNPSTNSALKSKP